MNMSCEECSSNENLQVCFCDSVFCQECVTYLGIPSDTDEDVDLSRCPVCVENYKSDRSLEFDEAREEETEIYLLSVQFANRKIIRVLQSLNFVQNLSTIKTLVDIHEIHMGKLLNRFLKAIEDLDQEEAEENKRKEAHPKKPCGKCNGDFKSCAYCVDGFTRS